MRTDKHFRSDITNDVLSELMEERARQHAKWGDQNCPSLDRVLLEREGGCSPERMAEDYEIPGENRAKFLCQNRFRQGEGTWGHILIEEVSEAIACLGDEVAMREELIQVAAVTVAWIEYLDRKAA